MLNNLEFIKCSYKQNAYKKIINLSFIHFVSLKFFETISKLFSNLLGSSYKWKCL